MLYKRPTTPTVAQLRAALLAYNAISYSNANLQSMSERDMLYAARLHGLTVAAPNTL